MVHVITAVYIEFSVTNIHYGVSTLSFFITGVYALIS